MVFFRCRISYTFIKISYQTATLSAAQVVTLRNIRRLVFAMHQVTVAVTLPTYEEQIQREFLFMIFEYGGIILR